MTILKILQILIILILTIATLPPRERGLRHSMK